MEEITPTEPSTEAVIEELGRILNSPELASSPQLSLLLRHVVETTLRGELDALKESAIALGVFRRPPDYDPKVDPIVRVEARRLRTKLDAYYAGRGRHDPVRIRLPKGGYVPVFSEAVMPAQIMEPAAALPSAARRREIRRAPFVAMAAGLVVVMAVALALSMVFMAPQGQPPDLVEAFWAGMLRGPQSCVLVPADSGLVMLQNIEQRTIPLNEYMTGAYLDKADDVTAAPVVFGTRRYTSIVDLQFGVRLEARAVKHGGDVRVRYARDLRPDDIKGANLIFLGAKTSNPWVELYEDQMTIRIVYDDAQKMARILNLSPQKGEQPSYQTDGTGEVYGVITYHPNQHGSGQVLTIGGTTVAGTEAAADFVLNNDRIRPYLEQAKTKDGIGGFDILVQSRNLAGTAPLAQVVAFHTEQARGRAVQ